LEPDVEVELDVDGRRVGRGGETGGNSSEDVAAAPLLLLD
jgi:hypothetical protein